MIKDRATSFLKQQPSRDVFLFFVSLLLLYHATNVMLNIEINADEIEHLHSAWYIKNGYIPFTDFFQHHSPFFWYLLVPFPGLGSDNPEVILHARVLMLLISVLTALIAAICAVKIGKTRTHGLLVFVIILSVLFFVKKGTSVRPDGLCVLFSVISFYFFLETNGDRSNTDRSNTDISNTDISNTDRLVRKNIILTSLFVSLAYLISPKAVFIYIFYVIYFTIKTLQKKIDFKTFSLFLLILATPFMISVAYGFATGGLQEYLFNCYLLNMSKASISGKLKGLIPIFRDNWFFWTVSFAGILYALSRRKQEPKLMATSLLGITVLAGAYKSSFYPQYYLPVVPFFAITSSIFLLKVAEFLLKVAEQAHKQRMRSLVIILFAGAYLWAPATNLKHAKNNNNSAKIEMMRYLTEKTPKNDCVYDEKRAFNIFRRDAHYLWYHPALRKKYISMTGNYSTFNRCEVIQRNQPMVVDARKFHFRKCDAFKLYEESRYEGFYLRTEKMSIR